MNRTISVEKKTELFENFQKARFSDHADGFETLVELPEEIGKGYKLEIELRPGLKLFFEDYHLQESLVANVEAEPLPWSVSPSSKNCGFSC